MTDDSVKYEQLVEKALRGVVRDVLEVASRLGLHDKQHFYVTFRTSHPKLRMPQWLLANHPDEMSIVIQHQFWDLSANEEGFEVTLSFGGKPENLYIPYSAITAFSDPAAKFGLQFRLHTETSTGAEDGSIFGHSPESSGAEDDDDVAVDADAADDDQGQSGKVVALDAFRKK